MLKTLRGRFVLSHILPLLVLVPLMGVVLVYVLETQVLLDALSDELMGQAVLIAQLLSDRPEVWLDPSRAQVFVARLDPRLDVQVMLLPCAGYSGERAWIPACLQRSRRCRLSGPAIFSAWTERCVVRPDRGAQDLQSAVAGRDGRCIGPRDQH